MSPLCRVGVHRWSIWGDVFFASGIARQARYCLRCRCADAQIVRSLKEKS